MRANRLGGAVRLRRRVRCLAVRFGFLFFGHAFTARRRRAMPGQMRKWSIDRGFDLNTIRMSFVAAVENGQALGVQTLEIIMERSKLRSSTRNDVAPAIAYVDEC